MTTIRIGPRTGSLPKESGGTTAFSSFIISGKIRSDKVSLAFSFGQIGNIHNVQLKIKKNIRHSTKIKENDNFKLLKESEPKIAHILKHLLKTAAKRELMPLDFSSKGIRFG